GTMTPQRAQPPPLHQQHPPHSWLLPGSDAGRYLRRHYSSSRLPSAKQTFAKGLFQVLNCLHKMKQMVMKNPYRDKAISHYPGACEEGAKLDEAGRRATRAVARQRGADTRTPDILGRLRAACNR